MSQKLKSAPTHVAEFRSVLTEELEQVDGGSKSGVVEVLLAMGYTYKDNLYLDKNGMSYTKRVWFPPKS